MSRLCSVRARAVVFLWAWQAVFALMAAWPAATVVRAAFAGDPGGDAAIFRPGGLALLAFLAHDAAGLRGALDGAAVTLVVGAAASLFPAGMLLFAIDGSANGRAPFSLKATVAPTVRAFPVFAVLFVGFGLAQGLLLGLAAFAAPFVAGLGAPLGEVRSQELAAAFVALLIPVAAYLAVLHDVARAAVARRHRTASAALAAGLQALRAQRWPLAWAWAWRGALSWAPLVALAVVPWSLDKRGALAFVAVAIVRQSTVLFRIALRASWLAVAIRTVGATVRAVRDEPTARD